MSATLDFAITTVRDAAELLRGYYNPAGIQASTKPDQTVVTEADLGADDLITTAIRREFPSHQIISEELTHQVSDGLAPTWIVDPLDGTTNFSLGLPIWGISLAHVINGIPTLGVAYFPLVNELYTAEMAAGASMNGVPIIVRAPDPAQPMSFFACCSRSFRHYEISIPYKPRILGSAVYSFCMVARGSALLGFDATPKIWDLAAVWLLVNEAGGVIMPFDGQSPFPVVSSHDFRTTSYPSLAGATSDLIAYGRRKIRKK